MQKNLAFTGSVVSCYTENEVLTVGIANDEHEPSQYVILTRLDEHADFEEASGQAIGFQTHLSDYESAAAVAALRLDGAVMEIWIKPDSMVQVGAESVKITLTVSQLEMAELVRYLHAIFDDFSNSISIDIDCEK